MKIIPFSLKEGIAKGLRPTPLNPRNSKFLVESAGMFPEDGVLRAWPTFTLQDLTGVVASFPYPQLFVTINYVIACTEDTIYEWIVDTWVERLSGLTPGYLWSLIDFGPYLALNNGMQVVKRNAVDAGWEIILDDTIPLCSSMCEVGGQVVLASPVIDASSKFQYDKDTRLIYLFHKYLHVDLPLYYYW